MNNVLKILIIVLIFTLIYFINVTKKSYEQMTDTEAIKNIVVMNDQGKLVISNLVVTGKTKFGEIENNKIYRGSNKIEIDQNSGTRIDGMPARQMTMFFRL